MKRILCIHHNVVRHVIGIISFVQFWFTKCHKFIPHLRYSFFFFFHSWCCCCCCCCMLFERICIFKSAKSFRSSLFTLLYQWCSIHHICVRVFQNEKKKKRWDGICVSSTFLLVRFLFSWIYSRLKNSFWHKYAIKWFEFHGKCSSSFFFVLSSSIFFSPPFFGGFPPQNSSMECILYLSSIFRICFMCTNFFWMKWIWMCQKIAYPNRLRYSNKKQNKTVNWNDNTI